MARNLDDIFGGVRTRPCEERDHYLIDRPSLFVGKLGQSSRPGLPGVLAWKSQDLSGNCLSVRAGNAHDSQSPTAWRRGNRDDCVV